MFSADRWAQAFLKSAGDNVNESLSALKAIVKGMGSIYCEGFADAQRLESILRSALKKTGTEGWGVELACRTIVLLARKHAFDYRQDLIAALERELNRRSGIITVTIDSASSLEPSIRSSFIEYLKAKTKADDIRITTRIIPELLGGYRLLMESEVFDASVKMQFEQMGRTIMKY